MGNLQRGQVLCSVQRSGLQNPSRQVALATAAAAAAAAAAAE